MRCRPKSIRFARFAFAFTDRLAARVSAAEARRAHIDVHLRRLIIAKAAGLLYLDPTISGFEHRFHRFNRRARAVEARDVYKRQTVRRVLSPRMRAFRAGVIFALYELGEIVFLVHRYCVSNSFEWRYVRNMTFRGALFTAITLLLIRPLSRMFLGKRGYLRSDYGKTREVKHF